MRNEKLRSKTRNPRTTTCYSSFLTPCTPWLILLAIALLSCQTAPKAPDVFFDGRLPLEPGGYVYVLAEKDAMPILKQFMLSDINSAQVQMMIELTRFAAAAVYVTPDEETGKLTSRYRLAAWGSYPASRAKMGLGSSKEWTKQRSAVSGADYWYSPQRGLSVAITGKMALVATAAPNGGQRDPYSAAPGTAEPEGFAAFREGSILSCWLTDPGPAINKKITEMGIPLEIPAEQVFVSLFPADGQRYIAHLQIQLPGASQARALTTMFALVRNFIPPQSELGILFANPPVQDGGNLRITTAPLSDREIALLLKMFSI